VIAGRVDLEVLGLDRAEDLGAPLGEVACGREHVCDYDWSKPDSVFADVKDSNIYNPEGSW
jgi:hypothetical protein